MPKALTVGNGNILVCLDNNAQVRDFYFPYVGLENHVGRSLEHRVGVWVDGRTHWFNEKEWAIQVACNQDVLAGTIIAHNAKIELSITITDIVYNEKNIYLRHFEIENLADRERTIKIFFGHEFELYESYTANTAYYDPFEHCVIHYRGKRAFLLNAMCENMLFDDYTTGVYGIENKEGSYRDADDGALQKNNIEHGPADSVIGIGATFAPHGKKEVYYWAAVGESIEEVKSLNTYVIQKGPEHLIETTSNYWKAWLGKRNWSFHGLTDPMITLFRKSQLIVRAHADNRGAIIASSDSDMLNQGKDTYSYMWPRDGAYCAIALDKAGDSNVAKRFFEFCNDVITADGYFKHKYGSDRALGSSWHPWIVDGNIQLPIQEDETAIVLIALWKHYELTKDLEFIEDIYNSLILKAGEFLASFRDKKTGLPKPTFDLWEEKLGIHTYTCATVYGALVSCANFAELLGKGETAQKFRSTAEEVKEATLKFLYDQESGVFYKMLSVGADGSHTPDKTVDMSTAFGLFSFGMLDATDPRVERFIEIIKERIALKTSIGGVARYENDYYYRVSKDTPGNPWFITTLWLARYYIETAVTEADLDPVKEIFEWVVEYAHSSGILSEQLDPFTGEQVSAAPLTWSHAEYVSTVIKYLNKLEHLGVCLACNPVKPK